MPRHRFVLRTGNPAARVAHALDTLGAEEMDRLGLCCIALGVFAGSQNFDCTTSHRLFWVSDIS